MSGQLGAEEEGSPAGGWSSSCQPSHLLQPPSLARKKKVLTAVHVPSNLVNLYNLLTRACSTSSPGREKEGSSSNSRSSLCFYIQPPTVRGKWKVLVAGNVTSSPSLSIYCRISLPSTASPASTSPHLLCIVESHYLLQPPQPLQALTFYVL